MKIRRWFTFGLGAAAGAGAMYLMDPEHGPQRRRAAAGRAWRVAREEIDLAAMAQSASLLLARAREGYEAAAGSEGR